MLRLHLQMNKCCAAVTRDFQGNWTENDNVIHSCILLIVLLVLLNNWCLTLACLWAVKWQQSRHRLMVNSKTAPTGWMGFQPFPPKKPSTGWCCMELINTPTHWHQGWSLTWFLLVLNLLFLFSVQWKMWDLRIFLIVKLTWLLHISCLKPVSHIWIWYWPMRLITV